MNKVRVCECVILLDLLEYCMGIFFYLTVTNTIARSTQRHHIENRITQSLVFICSIDMNCNVDRLFDASVIRLQCYT